MKLSRSSGLLLHPTSLASQYGIGDLGPKAREFVDFLHSSNQKFWQILPLQKPLFLSPYACVSAFAGNPYLISIDDLKKDGFLKEKIDVRAKFPCDKVVFRKVKELKDRIFRMAFRNFRSEDSFVKFCAENCYWLDDFCDYEILSEKYGKIWNKWPKPLFEREFGALLKMRKENRRKISEKKFQQWVFFNQWMRLRKYAAAKGVSIIGDIPMFVSYSSADVWARRDLFLLKDTGKPSYVAGVPPDHFSSNGQLWGNPVYDWRRMKKDGFKWWMERFKLTFNMYDYVRLDHFRGFYSYWRVPAGNRTARKGEWFKASGEEMFAILKKNMKDLPVIAEDLGYISAPIKRFRENFAFPGMKVLQFAFSGTDKNVYLPKNYKKNFVVYTGTHDNDTTKGWYRKCSKYERERINKFLGEVKEINWQMIEFAMASKAVLAIFPVQDILSLGSKARLNLPGKSSGNWMWKLSGGEFTKKIAARLASLTKKYGRM